MIGASSSGSRRWASAVDPTRSQNRTLTWRRSAFGRLRGAGGGRQEADDEIVDARALNTGNRAQQTLAMAKRCDAQIDQVGVGQVGHDVEVDRMRGKGRGILA